jgi:Fic family protein
MRKPLPAPTFTDIYMKVAGPKADQLVGLMTRLQAINVQTGKYFHWDEIQHRQPPEGLSREEWWFALKMSRTGTRQGGPLSDPKGTLFGYALVAPIPEQLHQIDLRAGGHIQMPEQVTNRETRDEYYVSSLIEEAITSSQLEGATTTRQVAKEMLRTGRSPVDRSERMILNNYITMRRIGLLKDQPLSKDLIFEIHELVTREALDDPTAVGRFRREDENIGVYDNLDRLMHQPPLASLLESRIEKLCDFANGSEPFVHPVIRSIILHFMIGYEHPFVDGNGRTARAIFYWSMLRHGYWLAEFISISQIVLKAPAQYGRAFLYAETDEGDLTYFILYHLKVIMRALESLHAYIARKANEIQRFEAELQGIETLNHRQRTLIRHAVRHPGKRYTVSEYQRTHNISYESARSDLLDLAQRDLFRGWREGKRWIFTPQTQLTGRLASLGTNRQQATLV